VCLALRLRHRDGAWRHVEAIAKNLLADPAVGGIVVNYRDVTARRAAEEARAAGERLLRAGFDRAVLGIALVDTAGTILASNPALQRLLGYDAAALCGQGLRDLTHPDDLAPNLDLLADVLAGRRDHYHLEKRYRHRAGHVVWGRVTVSTLPDANGGSQFLVAMVEDISARKGAEAALRRQNAHLAALHDTALALLSPRTGPAGLLGDIIARAGALVGTPDGYIYLLARGDDAMTVRVGTGIFRDGVGSRIRRGEGLGGRVWATGRPLAIAEYDAWPGRKAGMAPGRFCAIAGVPLTIGGAVVGVIGLAHVAPGHHFGAEELAILERFGALASLALEHGRLHDAARRELAEREAAEVALRERESRLRAQYQAFPLPTYTWRRDGDDFVFADYNQAADAFARGTLAAQLGRTAAVLYRELPTVTEHLTRCHVAGETLRGELCYRSPASGAQTTVVVTYIPVTPDLVVMHSEDVTARLASEGRYRALVEQAADGIFVTDEGGRFREVNARACAMLGYAREELLRLGATDVLDPADLAARPLATPMPGADPLIVERSMRRKDGTTFPAEASAKRLPDGRLQVILRDITTRRAAEGALRASEASLAEAQRLAHIGSWEYDHATGTLRWSDELFRIAGYPPQSFAPTTERHLGLVHPDDRERVVTAFRASAASGAPTDLDLRLIRPDGAVRVIRQRAESLRDPSGRPLKRLGVMHDVTEQRRLEERLAHQATHDPLTGLPNRALFHARLGDALARARQDGPPCAVLFLDLDHFKDVNDTLGHDAGDRLLREVAARLRAVVREGDTVARLGGDEFAALLPAVADAAGAVEVAERLRESLARPFLLEGRPFPLGASVGIAVGGPGYTRAEELLRDADVALYRAKAAGRGGHAVFHPRMQLQRLARMALEHDLAQALARGEFVLHYQPLVDLATGRVAEVEALVRWRCPGEGLIPPDRFLPALEGAGSLGALDRWVLRAACRQASAWHARDPAGAPRVAVNLAPATFQEPGLVAAVVAALDATGARPGWLRLEITEGAALADVAGAAATLRALGALGVGLALDDFGTGYSSLAHLQRLPVDTLKLDRAFFGAGDGGRERAIVRAVTELARGLGLAVVAEGLETAAQVAWALDAGCDRGQGYYFARPLPPDDLGVLLAAGAPADPPAPG
jgi:diguanylate cyclase (GGDEF)-like protein/PAS domain S-box-containing protein